MPNLETGATSALDLKSVGEDGVFSGYVSIFGVQDLGRDIVQKGAFANSLKSRPAGRVKVLREHDVRDPIGFLSELKEDDVGLYAEGKLILETVRGRETHALMKAGILDSFSIGYRTKSHRRDEKTRARLLDEIELHEVSIVTFPMLPEARIGSVKHEAPTDFSQLVAAINAARASL